MYRERLALTKIQMSMKNIWVFLSHSSKDYDKVCLVRNELEKYNFRPLMFFLKCLDDDKYNKEVENLIFREIDSRSRFPKTYPFGHF